MIDPVSVNWRMVNADPLNSPVIRAPGRDRAFLLTSRGMCFNVLELHFEHSQAQEEIKE